MRIIKKVIIVGDSKGIVIDKVVLRSMSIELGDEIVVDIVKKIKRNK